MTTAYFIEPPGEGRRTVSREEWLRVEREHGFIAQHPGEPATRSWSADGWRGWWVDAIAPRPDLTVRTGRTEMPRCYDCLTEDVSVKVIDGQGSEHWFCAKDWAAEQELHERIMNLLERGTAFLPKRQEG